MTNKPEVVSKLIISKTLADNPQEKEAIECYQRLVEQLSDKNFAMAVKHEIKRNPQSMAEAADDKNAWEWFEVAATAHQKLLDAWE